MSAKKPRSKNATAEPRAKSSKGGKTKPAPEDSAAPPEFDESGSEHGTDSNNDDPGGSGTGGPGSYSRRESREKIAELATQLVCAQIAASAHYRSARHLAIANLDVAEAMLMASARLHVDTRALAAGTAMDLLDMGHVERACQGLRKSVSCVETMPADAPTLDHPNLDDVFAAAMQRACSLLGPPGEDRTIVHAEQLFPPDAVLTEKKMEEVFKAWNWPVLKNHSSFVEKINQLEDWYAARYENLRSSVVGTDGEDDLQFMQQAFAFLSRHGEEEHYRNLKTVIEDLAALNDERERYAPPAECLWNDAWQRHLILQIFGGRVPGRRARNATRKYNAWGLFRYLRVFGGEDAEGTGLPAVFRCERHKLNRDKYPGPITVSPARCFGQLGDLAERRLYDEHKPAEDQIAVDQPAE